MKKFKIGTRGSELALKQANFVLNELKPLESEIIIIQTKGDLILDKPMHKIGDKGLFTAELEKALYDQTIDIAIHSLKDLPTKIAENLPIIAIPKREDPRDCFIFADKFKHLKSYTQLPEGSIIGTSSLRRIIQLQNLRPDFQFLPLRGNIGTRLRKIHNSENLLAAGVLAVAGLKRLALTNCISEILPISEFLPAPAQGALAIQINIKTLQENKQLADKLKDLNHQETYIIANAERASLQAVDGGCQTPFGVYGEIINEKYLKLSGFIGNKEKEGKTINALYKAEEIGEIADFRDIGKRLGNKLKSFK